MSQPAWRDLAPKTSALGSSPDSIACSLPPPTPLLQARPPATTVAEVSQLFQVAKPFTLPENERSHAPALKPISACTTEALPRARAAATASEVFLSFITLTRIICTSFLVPTKQCLVCTDKLLAFARGMYARCASRGKRSIIDAPFRFPSNSADSLHTPRQAFHN